MATTEMFYNSMREMEDRADQVKACVLHALVSDGTLPEETAEAWATTHTVLYRKRSFFRTLSSLWRKTKPGEGAHEIIIVAKVPYVALAEDKAAESEASDA